MMACLIGEPNRCREMHITLADDLSPMTCMLVSQKIISNWANEKPGFNENFFIKKWRCEFVTGKDI